MYVIGIDGGGTKTTGVLADIKGNVIAEATVLGTNPNSEGIELAKTEMKKLLTILNKLSRDKNIVAVFAGMSGVSKEQYQHEFLELIKNTITENIPILVDHDAINALYSGTLGRDGIVQISGTGSITYGVNKHKIWKRVGGWGYLLGDTGSGYQIGQSALIAVLNNFDGMAKRTLLRVLIQENFNIKSIGDITSVIYSSPNSQRLIASLFPVVAKAYDLGDEVAKNIIQDAGRSIGISISQLLHELFLKDEEVPVVLAGGVFHRADLFVPVIDEHVRIAEIKTNIIVPNVPPVAGAVIAAWKLLGKDVDQQFYQNFNSKGES